MREKSVARWIVNVPSGKCAVSWSASAYPAVRMTAIAVWAKDA